MSGLSPAWFDRRGLDQGEFREVGLGPPIQGERNRLDSIGTVGSPDDLDPENAVFIPFLSKNSRNQTLRRH